MINNNKNSIVNDFKKVWKISKKMILYVIILIIISYLLSGIYSVQQNEIGVLTLFGKIVNDRILPGIHYRLPYPLSNIYKLNVKETKNINIGYGFIHDKGKLSSELKYKMSNYENSYSITDFKYLDENIVERQFMTSDKNIIELLISIQYSIVNPVKYLFSYDNPEKLIKSTSENILQKLLSSKIIDDILIRDSLMERYFKLSLQSKLDKLSVGVSILSIIFQDVSVPKGAVEKAFKDVKSAEDDKGKRIEEAKRKSHEIEVEANTEVQNIKNNAEIEAEKITNKANSFVATYNKLQAKNKQDNNITALRIYIETMENVFSKVKKYILSNNKSIESYFLDAENQ